VNTGVSLRAAATVLPAGAGHYSFPGSGRRGCCQRHEITDLPVIVEVVIQVIREYVAGVVAGIVNRVSERLFGRPAFAPQGERGNTLPFFYQLAAICSGQKLTNGQ
jgi:hypothetical protein